MRNQILIADHLKRVCGLEVRPAREVFSAEDGIVQNGELGITVFTVEASGKKLAFELDGCDGSARVTAALAREVALSLLKSKQSLTDEPVRAFLSGEGDIPNGIKNNKSEYYVFAVSCKSSAAVREYLSTMATKDDLVADMSDGITAFCKKTDSENDYRSAGEMSEVLYENLAEEIKDNIKIGVGGVAYGVAELPVYYGYARTALMGSEFDKNSDIYSYKDYAFVRALSSLTSAELEKFVKTALDRNYREVLDDPELMTAAEEVLAHSLNISEASRSMYVHRNTLIYRLDKLERLTGLNIRSFNDAMTFRAACLAHKLL